MKHYLALAAAAGLLAGCAKPIPATFTPADVTSSHATYTTLAALPATSGAAMPVAGSASYTGLMSGDFNGSSSASGGFLGNLALNVNFASGQVSGAATNFNFIDIDGTPVQTAGGRLTVSGNAVGNTLAATANGALTAVYKIFKGSATFNLALGGTFRTNATAADTITGAMTGYGSGNAYGQAIYLGVTNGRFAVQK